MGVSELPAIFDEMLEMLQMLQRSGSFHKKVRNYFSTNLHPLFTPSSLPPPLFLPFPSFLSPPRIPLLSLPPFTNGYTKKASRIVIHELVISRMLVSDIKKKKIPRTA